MLAHTSIAPPPHARRVALLYAQRSGPPAGAGGAAQQGDWLSARVQVCEGAQTKLTDSDELVRTVLLETRQIIAQLTPLAEQAQQNNATGSVPPSSAEPMSSAPPSSVATGASDPALAAQLITLHLNAHRNKRCLLTYHKQRIDWLKARIWDKAGAVALVLDEDQPENAPGGASVVSIRPLLAPSELEWIRSYAALLALYKDVFLDVLDVTLPLSSGASGSLRDGRITTPNAARSALGAASFTKQGAPGNVSVYETYTPPNTVHAPLDLLVTVVATRDARNVETERGTLHLRAGERLRVRRDEIDALLIRGWLRVAEE